MKTPKVGPTATIWEIQGKLLTEVVCFIENGKIVTVTGKKAKELEAVLDHIGDPATRVLAEFGIGLNPKAELCGSMLEDEGCLVIGRAESLRHDYQTRLAARRQALLNITRRSGWGFAQHRTDRPPQAALLGLYQALSSSLDSAPPPGIER